MQHHAWCHRESSTWQCAGSRTTVVREVIFEGTIELTRFLEMASSLGQSYREEKLCGYPFFGTVRLYMDLSFLREKFIILVKTINPISALVNVSASLPL